MDNKKCVKDLLESFKKCEIANNYYILKPEEITLLLDFIQTEISLEETRKSHVETLLEIIKHIQYEMKLAIDPRIDREDETEIINELIYWIDELMGTEK